jgi:uncharacterized delta-60 repeat protein
MWMGITIWFSRLPIATATPGSLDVKVRTDLGGTYDWAYSTVIQPNGEIIAAGVSNAHGTYDFALTNYSSNGALNWVKLTDFDKSYDWAYSLALQPDGKIVLGGVSNSHFALARYDSNGFLDANFGDGGKIIEKRHQLTSDIIHGIAIQPDGKILAAGTTVDNVVTLNPQGDFMIARYNSDGSPDLTFGIGGIVTTDFNNGSYDDANALALQPDGKFILGGYTNTRSKDALYGPDHFALARYFWNGTLDPNFGEGGKIVINGNSLKEAITAIVIGPDQTILAAGFISGENRGDLFLTRLQPNGIPSIGWGNTGGGQTIENLGTNSERITSLALQPNGKIVAGGQTAVANNADFSIFRFNYNGILDPSFGKNGIATVDFEGREDRVHAVAIQQNGRIIAIGQSETDFALVRFNNN